MSEKIICRCEEITETEIEEAIKHGAVTVDDVKRFTRAGMGLCQGRTCWRLVAAIIARETGRSPEEIQPPNRRAPVRPLAVEELGKAALEEGRP